MVFAAGSFGRNGDTCLHGHVASSLDGRTEGLGARAESPGWPGWVMFMILLLETPVVACAACRVLWGQGKCTEDQEFQSSDSFLLFQPFAHTATSMRIGLICIFRLGYLLLVGPWAMHWDRPCGHLRSPQCPKEQSIMTAPRVESVRTKGMILTGTLKINSLNYNYEFNHNF